MYQDLNHNPQLAPLWGTINITVATLWANWIWAGWFSQAQGTAAFLLMLGCLAGWPLTLGLLAQILGLILKRCESQPWLCMVVVSAVIGVGVWAYGVPRPWSLAICAVVAITMGLQARRAAQDDADLEDL